MNSSMTCILLPSSEVAKIRLQVSEGKSSKLSTKPLQLQRSIAQAPVTNEAKPTSKPNLEVSGNDNGP